MIVDYLVDKKKELFVMDSGRWTADGIYNNITVYRPPSTVRQIFLILLSLSCTYLSAQIPTNDSGGQLIFEQAAYDVHFYDLELAIDPEDRRIEGQLEMAAKMVHPSAWIAINLDPVLQISSIQEGERVCEYLRKEGLVYVALQTTRQRGEVIHLSIDYAGQPRVAPRPPWDGGFTWKKTKSGEHWIATTCQQEGADLWCKGTYTPYNLII